MRRRWIMNYAKTYKSKEMFPGAIVYYVVTGDTKKKLRGKIKAIKNHSYDSVVYDKTDYDSNAKYDCQMTGVRVSCDVLEDLFFRKKEYPNAGITLYYHTNLMERINCVVVCLENNGRKQFFMIVPCKESMTTTYIHLINDIDETLALGDVLVANNAKLDNFTTLGGIAKYFGTETVEEVVYVHTMQSKCTKYYGHPLKLHWRPLPNMEDNPKVNIYPEDWFEAWNNADSIACLGLKYAYNFYRKDGEMMAVFPITKEVLDVFFSIPQGADKEAFLADIEYECFNDILDKYPEIIPRINDTVRLVSGSYHEDYTILNYYITYPMVREAAIPQYKNSLHVKFQVDEDSVSRICKQFSEIFKLPKEQLPEYSFFYRNYNCVTLIGMEGDCENCPNKDDCRLIKK